MLEIFNPVGRIVCVFISFCMGNRILFRYDNDHGIQKEIVQPVYIALIAVIAAVTAILILSFAGPEHSESRFWRTVHSVRRGMDFVSYWFFNAMAVLTIVIAVYVLVLKIRGMI